MTDSFVIASSAAATAAQEKASRCPGGEGEGFRVARQAHGATTGGWENEIDAHKARKTPYHSQPRTPPLRLRHFLKGEFDQ